MGNDLYLDGKKFISSRRAAANFGYTQDYIGQLIRGKKIDAKMIGRSWFVSESALAEYQVSFGNPAKAKGVIYLDEGKARKTPKTPKAEETIKPEEPKLESPKEPPKPAEPEAPKIPSSPKSPSKPRGAAIKEIGKSALVAVLLTVAAVGAYSMSASSRGAAGYPGSSLLAAVGTSAGESFQNLARGIYETIHPLLFGFENLVASLFGNNTAPTTPESTPESAPRQSQTSQNIAITATSTRTVVVSPPAPPSIVYTVTGLTAEAVDARIKTATGDLAGRIATLEDNVPVATTNTRNTYENINTSRLDGSRLTDGAIVGGTISSTSISALDLAVSGNSTFTTASFGLANATNLFATNATATNLFATNAAFGSVTSYASPFAPYFVATSSTASVFPYASTTALTVSGTGYFSQLGLGTSSPFATLDILQKTNGVPIISAYRSTDSAPSGDFIDYYSKAGSILFRVDNSGNLLAGGIVNTGSQTITSVSSPQFRVQYDGSNEITTAVTSTGSTTLGLNGSTPSLTFTPQSNLVQAFNFTNAAGNSVLTIDTQNQRVGISTTTPLAKLSVAGDAYIGGNLTATGTLSVSGTSTFSNASTTNLSIANNLWVGGNSTTTSNGNFTTNGRILVNANGTAAAPAIALAGALSNGFYTDDHGVLYVSSGSGGAGIQFGKGDGNTAELVVASNAVIGFSSNPLSTFGLQDATFSRLGPAKVSLGSGLQGDTSGTFITGNIGVGTTAPFAKLSVANFGGTQPQFIVASSTGSGATTTSLIVDKFGNVGVGETNPQSKLQVDGNQTSPSLSSDTSIFKVSTGSALVQELGFGLDSGGAFGAWLQTKRTGNDGTSYPLELNPIGGNVGVGTANPVSLLQVGSRNSNQSVGNVPVVLAEGTNSGTSVQTILRLGRAYAGSGSPFPASADINLYSYANDLSTFTPKTQLDFTLKSAASWTETGDTTVLSLRDNGNVGIGTTNPLAPLHISTPQTASSGVARGAYLNQTLTASANSDVLSSLDVVSTYVPGAFTGVTRYAGRFLSEDPGGTSIAVGRTNSFFSTLTTDFSTRDFIIDTGNLGGPVVLKQAGAVALTTGSAQTDVAGALTIGATASAFGLNNAIQVQNSVDGYILFRNGTNGNKAAFGHDGNGDTIFYNQAGNTNLTAADEKMRILANGNVGIGTTSPQAKLNVSSGDIRVDSGNNFLNLSASSGGVPLIRFFGLGISDLSIAGDGRFSFINNEKPGTVAFIDKQGNINANGNLVLGSGGVSGASSGIGFSGPGVRNANLVYRPNTNQFEFHTDDNANGTNDNYGAPSLIVPGNLGIGSTSPFTKLSVAGDAYIGGNLTATGTLSVLGSSAFANASTTNLSVANNLWVGGNSTTTSNGNLTTNGSIVLASNGSAASPILKLAGAPSNGFYTDNHGVLYLSSGSGDGIQFGRGDGGTAELVVASNAVIGFANSAVSTFANQDATFSRLGASKIAVGNGTQGDFSGTLVAGNIGVGTNAPGAKVEIVGQASAGILKLDGGDNQAGGNAITQIAFGFAGTNQYPHFIRTRHNAGTATNNAIDFFTSDGTAAGVFPTNAILGLTITAGNVGIATTSPFTKLSVAGDAYIGGNLTATGTTYLATTGGNVGIGTTDTTLNGAIASKFTIVTPNNTAIAIATTTTSRGFALNVNPTGGFTMYDGGASGSSWIGGITQLGGNVGVGTTNPISPLDVVGNVRSSGNNSGFRFDDRTTNRQWQWYGSGDIANLWNGSGNVVSVTSGGNVGIGTTTPGGLLTLSSSVGDNTTTNVLRLDNTAGSASGRSAIGFYQSQPGFTSAQISSNPGSAYNASKLFFSVADVNRTLQDRMVIDLNGNVGIGTTTPSSKLQVYDTGNSTETGISLRSGGGTLTAYTLGRTSSDAYWGLAATAGQWFTGSAAGDIILTTAGSGQKLYLGGGGTSLVMNNSNVGIGTTSPSRKLDIVDSTNPQIRLSKTLTNYIELTGDGNGSGLTLANSAGSVGSIFGHMFGGNTYSGLVNLSATDLGLAAASGHGVAIFPNGNATPSVYVNTSGNVGIGTTTPASRLAVSGGATIGADYNIAAPTNGLFVEGNTSIGTLSSANFDANSKLDVAGDITVYGYNRDSSSAVFSLTHAPASAAAIPFINNIVTNYVNGANLNTAITFQTRNTLTNTERMRIDANGNVGIGTSTPASTLDIFSNVNAGALMNAAQLLLEGNSNNVGLQLNNYQSGGRAWGVLSNGGSASISSAFRVVDLTSSKTPFVINSSDDIGLGGNITNSSMAGSNVTILNSGNVGIGTTTPQTKLDIDNGDLSIHSNGLLRFYTTNGANYGFIKDSGLAGGDPNIGFYVSGNNPDMFISSLGKVGIGTTSPSSPLHIARNGTNGVLNEMLVVDTGTENQTVSGSGATIAFKSLTSSYYGAVGGYGNGSAAGVGLWSGSGSGAPNLYATGGLVGIGTTSPSNTLTVVGSACFSQGPGVASIACGTTAGNIYYKTNNAGNYDVAENYKTSDLSVSAGDIVALDPLATTTIDKASSGSHILGIVSTDPGMILGGADATMVNASSTRPVALSGRVPVKVDGENGNISVGDKISLSSVPGVGKKAAGSEETVGIALESWSGTALDQGLIDVFVSNKSNIDPSQFTVDGSGNIGIGTTTPEYKLQVMGDIAAQSFVNISTRTEKKDISYLDDTTKLSMLERLKTLGVATYRYNDEDPSTPLHLGLIAEESPSDILADTGKGVDIYKLSTFILAGVQEMAGKLDSIETRVASAESTLASTTADVAVLKAQVAALVAGQANGAASSTSVATSTIVSTVSGWFASLGVSIDNAAAHFGSVLADLVTAHTIVTNALTVGSADNLAAAGITTFDHATGQPVCMYVDGGIVRSSPGTCGTATVAATPAGMSSSLVGTEPTPVSTSTVSTGIGGPQATTDQTGGSTAQGSGTSATTSPAATSSATSTDAVSATATSSPAVDSATSTPAAAPAPAPVDQTATSTDSTASAASSTVSAL